MRLRIRFINYLIIDNFFYTGSSNPNKIGWNVPDKKPTGTNTAPKPSAPISEQSAKTSATNVQSGYNPSGIQFFFQLNKL